MPPYTSHPNSGPYLHHGQESTDDGFVDIEVEGRVYTLRTAFLKRDSKRFRELLLANESTPAPTPTCTLAAIETLISTFTPQTLFHQDIDSHSLDGLHRLIRRAMHGSGSEPPVTPRTAIYTTIVTSIIQRGSDYLGLITPLFALFEGLVDPSLFGEEVFSVLQRHDLTEEMQSSLHRTFVANLSSCQDPSRSLRQDPRPPSQLRVQVGQGGGSLMTTCKMITALFLSQKLGMRCTTLVCSVVQALLNCVTELMDLHDRYPSSDRRPQWTSFDGYPSDEQSWEKLDAGRYPSDEPSREEMYASSHNRRPQWTSSEARWDNTSWEHTSAPSWERKAAPYVEALYNILSSIGGSLDHPATRTWLVKAWFTNLERMSARMSAGCSLRVMIMGLLEMRANGWVPLAEGQSSVASSTAHSPVADPGCPSQSGPSWPSHFGPSYPPHFGPSHPSHPGPSYPSQFGPSHPSQFGPSHPTHPFPEPRRETLKLADVTRQEMDALAHLYASPDCYLHLRAAYGTVPPISSSSWASNILALATILTKYEFVGAASFIAPTLLEASFSRVSAVERIVLVTSFMGKENLWDNECRLRDVQSCMRESRMDDVEASIDHVEANIGHVGANMSSINELRWRQILKEAYDHLVDAQEPMTLEEADRIGAACAAGVFRRRETRLKGLGSNVDDTVGPSDPRVRSPDTPIRDRSRDTPVSRMPPLGLAVPRIPPPGPVCDLFVPPPATRSFTAGGYGPWRNESPRSTILRYAPPTDDSSSMHSSMHSDTPDTYPVMPDTYLVTPSAYSVIPDTYPATPGTCPVEATPMRRAGSPPPSTLDSASSLRGESSPKAMDRFADVIAHESSAATLRQNKGKSRAVERGDDGPSTSQSALDRIQEALDLAWSALQWVPPGLSEPGEGQQMKRQAFALIQLATQQLDSARRLADVQNVETCREGIVTPHENIATPHEDIATPYEDFAVSDEDVATPPEDIAVPMEEPFEGRKPGDRVLVVVDGRINWQLVPPIAENGSGFSGPQPIFNAEPAAGAPAETRWLDSSPPGPCYSDISLSIPSNSDRGTSLTRSSSAESMPGFNPISTPSFTTPPRTTEICPAADFASSSSTIASCSPLDFTVGIPTPPPAPRVQLAAGAVNPPDIPTQTRLLVDSTTESAVGSTTESNNASVPGASEDRLLELQGQLSAMQRQLQACMEQRELSSVNSEENTETAPATPSMALRSVETERQSSASARPASAVPQEVFVMPTRPSQDTRLPSPASDTFPTPPSPFAEGAVPAPRLSYRTTPSMSTRFAAPAPPQFFPPVCPTVNSPSNPPTPSSHLDNLRSTGYACPEIHPYQGHNTIPVANRHETPQTIPIWPRSPSPATSASSSESSPSAMTPIYYGGVPVPVCGVGRLATVGRIGQGNNSSPQVLAGGTAQEPTGVTPFGGQRISNADPSSVPEFLAVRNNVAATTAPLRPPLPPAPYPPGFVPLASDARPWSLYPTNFTQTAIPAPSSSGSPYTFPPPFFIGDTGNNPLPEQPSVNLPGPSTFVLGGRKIPPGGRVNPGPQFVHGSGTYGYPGPQWW